MNLSPQDCATELLETVPLMMRVIRSRVRAHSSPELSMPQFRTLAFLGRNEGAMLGDVAAFLTLTLSAASKLVDGLVNANLVTRANDLRDRRKVVLKLTPGGQDRFNTVRRATADFLAQKMVSLTQQQRVCIVEALHTLQEAFTDEPEVRGAPSKEAALAALP